MSDSWKTAAAVICLSLIHYECKYKIVLYVLVLFSVENSACKWYMFVSPLAMKWDIMVLMLFPLLTGLTFTLLNKIYHTIKTLIHLRAISP